jgi:hypothetical protein
MSPFFWNQRSPNASYLEAEVREHRRDLLAAQVALPPGVVLEEQRVFLDCGEKRW